ncbi:MAG: hypothetical protein PHV28_17025 [Kiritimatiellae bacterium]|nr:hypothetical protein [Kiritimatiellia bacterium]
MKNMMITLMAAAAMMGATALAQCPAKAEKKAACKCEACGCTAEAKKADCKCDKCPCTKKAACEKNTCAKTKRCCPK